MSINLFYFVVIFIIINIRSFRLMVKDKRTAVLNKSKVGTGRISEASLFLNSLFMGFVGIGLGMILLRHKVRKSYFKFGVPFTALINVLIYNLGKEKLIEDFNYDFYYDPPSLNAIRDFVFDFLAL